MEKEKKELEKAVFEKLFEEKSLEKAEEKADTEFFGEEDFEGKEDLEHEEAKEENPEHGDYHFNEHGMDFSADKKAVEAFAKAVGRRPEEVIRIYENGCRYEKVFEELLEARKDSESFEKLAKLRGLSKEKMKAEIFGAIEKAKTEKIVEKLMEENPGMNRETAAELAKFRINAKKPEAKEKEEEEDMTEKLEAMLREMEIFASRHRDIENLDNEVIEEWEKGVPLEKAFLNFYAEAEKKKLVDEIEKMKLEKEKNERKAYMKEHSPGSATSAAGTAVKDAFIEGLFKEY